MPLGILGFLDSYKINGGEGGDFPEPTSVLDTFRSPSSFLSSSTTTTLSSSHGGGGGGLSGGCAAAAFTGSGFEDLDGEQSIPGDVVNPGSAFVGFNPCSGSDPFIDYPNPLFGFPDPEIILNPDPGIFSIGSDPPTKRQWSFPFSDPGQDSFTPSTLIIDQLFNAATELNGTSNGNHILAQEILARLNQNLNSSNNNNPKPPFQKAALNIIEALHTLLQHSSSSSSLSPPHPQTLILKIAAHKAFSETSPFTQFINFTTNQTILESIQGFSDRIHIVDFDIGLGTQWSSLVQELAGKSVKITAFASPSTLSDEFELRFTEENLKNFAREIGVSLEIELLNIEVLLNPTYWPLSLLRSSTDKEAIAVNLPISSIVSGYLPLILRFLKQISPNVVVCSDRSCDIDAPFPNVVIHGLHYYTSLLESIGNPIQEAVERFYLQPSILKLLTNRMERSPPWRSLFGQCGFSPVAMSQTAEIQAEYLLQMNPMRGFHLEKRQSSSLVLCWERKELVTVSVWKC